MPLTTAFRNDLVQAIVGGTYTPYNNSNTSIGVGDSSTAFAVGQTDLQAATNKFRKPMDATYPSVATNVVTYRSTFALADANFAWNEYAIFNTTSSTGGTMQLREVQSNGTKASNETKQFTITVTYSVT